MITFRVMGQPVGKARPRVTRAGRVYTPKKTEQAEDDIRAMATYAMCGDPPLAGPLELTVRFLMAVPASWSKAKQRQAYEWEIQPTGRPDLDNLLKTVMDACNNIVYADDSQVVSIRASKRYASETEQPMVIVSIEPA